MNDSLIQQLNLNAETCQPAKGGGFLLSGPQATVGLPAEPRRYLYHGWQSWSLTAWVDARRRLPVMRPARLHPMQTDPAYARLKQPHGSWYGAVEMPDGQVAFLGALDLEAHVALEGRTLKGWYESGRGEWFVGAGDEAELLARYAQLLGERYGRGRVTAPQRVWCSWYSLYTQIDEPRLLKILADLGDLPFDVFQVDDGWQLGIGDWEANAKFPAGMDGLANRINASGRKAGLWLAPLLVAPSTRLYAEHADWLLRDEKGQPVSAGYNWGEPLYALDTTHPEALDWLAALMKKVRAWGYDYIKLDFLYAGALPGVRKGGLPREAAYRHGLQIIREALGDAYFLTCGAPILPSLGLCDGMRVGPDVSAAWESALDRDLLTNPTVPGARNAVRTTLNRLWLQPLVQTDPDVVYFRTRQNGLNAEQRRLVQDLGRAAGFKATSDVPTWLTEAERSELREYLGSDPQVRKAGRSAYVIGERTVDFSQAVELPPAPGFFTRLIGPLVAGISDVPFVIHQFDELGKRALHKALEENPV